MFTHSINSVNHRGDSLLIVSAENGYSEFCRTLSADPEFALHYHRNTEGVTALLAAARRGYVGVCEFFVLEERYRAQLEVTDNLGNNAFLYAASSFRFAEDLERVFFNTGAGADGEGPAVAGVNLLGLGRDPMGTPRPTGPTRATTDFATATTSSGGAGVGAAGAEASADSAVVAAGATAAAASTGNVAGTEAGQESHPGQAVEDVGGGPTADPLQPGRIMMITPGSTTRLSQEGSSTSSSSAAGSGPAGEPAVTPVPGAPPIPSANPTSGTLRSTSSAVAGALDAAALSSGGRAARIHGGPQSGGARELKFPLSFYQATNHAGRNALHLGAADGALHICRFLLRKENLLQLRRDSRDRNGLTPYDLLQEMMVKNRWDKNQLYVDFLAELADKKENRDEVESSVSVSGEASSSSASVSGEGSATSAVPSGTVSGAGDEEETADAALLDGAASGSEAESGREQFALSHGSSHSSQ